jgi:hypothetical protein
LRHGFAFCLQLLTFSQNKGLNMEKLSMRAKFNGLHNQNGKNYGGEKETTLRMIVVGKRGKELAPIVEARFYMGRSSSASNVYCSLWVHGAEYCAGHGVAGGYGYHKESAALQGAIKMAGITLFGSNYARAHDQKRVNFKDLAHIGGCGYGSMETALKAIARAAGAKGPLLIV